MNYVNSISACIFSDHSVLFYHWTCSEVQPCELTESGTCIQLEIYIKQAAALPDKILSIQQFLLANLTVSHTGKSPLALTGSCCV